MGTTAAGAGRSAPRRRRSDRGVPAVFRSSRFFAFRFLSPDPSVNRVDPAAGDRTAVSRKSRLHSFGCSRCTENSAAGVLRKAIRRPIPAGAFGRLFILTEYQDVGQNAAL